MSTLHGCPIDLIADALRPSIAEVEASIPATKGHYGFYLGLISRYNGTRDQAVLLARALVKAGANRQGVRYAMLIAYS